MKEVFIISACRTAIGKFQGALKPLNAVELGTLVVGAAVERARIEAGAVDEVIMGNVLQAGLGQNPARQTALKAGLPPSVAAFTLNKVCGSSLKAVTLAAQAIQVGDIEIAVAGGMESMTNAPYLLLRGRDGYRLGNGELVDSMIHDGLWDVYEDYHMGCTAEVVSERYGVGRERQDKYSVRSHQRALEANRSGQFDKEIVSVEIPQREGKPVVFKKDEGPRDSSLEGLAALKPVFQKDGTVTAGNASQLSDGAAALIVCSEEVAGRNENKPLARIVASATSGVEPALVMMAPERAIKKVLKRANWSFDEVDLFEINEAFAVQSVALCGQLEIDPAKLNVNGGAVALGHPIGASGARVLTTLLYALENRDLRKGVASLCLGGGNAVAMAVERV